MIDWYEIRYKERSAEQIYKSSVAEADALLLAGLHKYAHAYEMTRTQADAKMRIVYACDRDARVAAINALHRARQEARA
jgi:hypothetical protein